MNEFLTPEQAAKLLQVPVSWIYGQNHLKRFPAGVAVKVGRYLRLDREKLIAWIQGGENA